jgi:putative salt-induced outer membrane protein YdiY
MPRAFVIGLFGLSLLAQNMASAQIVNVLGKVKDTKDGIHGSLGFSFGFKTGNTNLVQAKAEGGFSYRQHEHIFFLIGRARFGTKEDITKFSLNSFDQDLIYISRSFTHFRYRYEVLDWLNSDVFVQHEADRFRDLSLRFVSGLGPVFSFEPIEDLQLGLGTSYMFEHESYRKALIPSAISHRWSNYLQISYAFDDDLLFSHTTFFQPRLAGTKPVVEQTGDVIVSQLRIYSESALHIKINSWLGFKLAFQMRYNSTTPPQAEDLSPTDAPREIVAHDLKAVQRLDTGFDTTLVLNL